MGTEFYEKFRERGAIGLRQRMMDGSKISVYDISRLDGMEKLRVKDLEFYRDNKNRLPDEFLRK